MTTSKCWPSSADSRDEQQVTPTTGTDLSRRRRCLSAPERQGMGQWPGQWRGGGRALGWDGQQDDSAKWGSGPQKCDIASEKTSTVPHAAEPYVLLSQVNNAALSSQAACLLTTLGSRQLRLDDCHLPWAARLFQHLPQLGRRSGGGPALAGMERLAQQAAADAAQRTDAQEVGAARLEQPWSVKSSQRRTYGRSMATAMQ